tara:strand:- start:692 stop:1567 length:876 start_codon:yes stop_codon:yes gene_type:complete
MVLEWYVFALLGSLFISVAYIFEKKVLSIEHSVEYASTKTFFMFIFCLFLLPFIDLKIGMDNVIFLYLISLFTTMATVFRVKAFRHMDISLSVPFMNLQPLVIVFLAYLFLNENITQYQFAGILIIVLGTYLLESDGHIKNYRSFFNKIKTSKYFHYIIYAIIFFSLEAILVKKYLSFNSNFLIFTFYFWAFTMINFYLIILFRYDGLNQIKKGISESKFWIIFIALFFFIGSIFGFKALTLGPVSLVIAIKQFGSVISTIVGGLLFHEEHTFLRTICSILMFTGAYLIIV